MPPYSQEAFFVEGAKLECSLQTTPQLYMTALLFWTILNLRIQLSLIKWVKVWYTHPSF